MPARNVFVAATHVEPTPYTALFIEKQVRDLLLGDVRQIYAARHGKLIGLCYYSYGLEPFSLVPDVKASAAVNDRNGLQIILCTVDGKTHRKDGIPYHMIWSADEGLGTFPTQDQNYKWPVRYLKENPNNLRDLQTVFAEATFPRVVPDLVLQAERLANAALQEMSGNVQVQRYNGHLDILPLHGIRLGIASNYGTIKMPDITRVYQEDGKQKITFMLP